MKPKHIPGLALVLSGGLVVLFLWSFGRQHSWTQKSEIVKFHSGERLVREDHYLSAFVQTTLENSRLFLQWPDGRMELLASTNHYATANHYALSQDGDMYVICAGRTVYYRQKKSPDSQWNLWTLTASPEIYDFIKKYLDAHSPGSYASESNEFAPAGAFKIKCNHLGEEQPLVIAPQGDSPYAYEIESIRNQGRELVAVPFASNPFAPQKLIFTQTGDFGGWKFDGTLTAGAN